MSAPQREDEINEAARVGQVPRGAAVHYLLEDFQITRAINRKERPCGVNGKL